MKGRIVYSIILSIISMVSLSAQTLKVAAAANLRYVLEDIRIAYSQKNPKVKLNLVFGSSGTMMQQISNGAVFDLFMAADNEFPVKLEERGLTSGQVTTYAFGKLALYSKMLNVNKKGLDALRNTSVKKIAVANPATAPYGERSIELLQKIKMYDLLKPKIVIADNISQAAQYTFTGNAEVGFVALSLALAPEMVGKGSYYVIPEDMYTPIEQAFVTLKSSEEKVETEKFKEFILSPEAKPIWDKWGYDTVVKE